MGNRIQITDTIEETIIKMSEGNPGAINILMLLMKANPIVDPQNAFKEMGTILTLDVMGIYGTDLYILYNDKCDRDIRKLIMLIRAYQLGFIDRKDIILLSKDQMNRMNFSDKYFDQLDKKVCKQLKDFQRKE